MYTVLMQEKRRGCKLRKGRMSITGQISLITCVTMQRQKLFSETSMGRIVVKEMSQSESYGVCETLAFVIMPDHFHWLMTVGSQYTLSKIICGVKSHSARMVNHRLRRHGAVWQRGFHDHALRRDEDILHVARYIIANPLRAGLVKRVGDYPLWDAAWL